ncbi:hypothetical protein BJY01DRAFT_33815 [Aspergillus pseudoustus]|uniref:Uncharacterized protein n=1 Tax=Aspergillus pseudoustus TaxID=1810923 RepID=A0ABR4JFE4_9EURO
MDGTGNHSTAASSYNAHVLCLGVYYTHVSFRYYFSLFFFILYIRRLGRRLCAWATSIYFAETFGLPFYSVSYDYLF